MVPKHKVLLEYHPSTLFQWLDDVLAKPVEASWVVCAKYGLKSLFYGKELQKLPAYSTGDLQAWLFPDTANPRYLEQMNK
jgi:hypothetical protein